MKNWKRTAKNGITNPKKDWKEWKDPFQKREKMKKKLERERSFVNGNAFLFVPVPTNFGERTSLHTRSCKERFQRRARSINCFVFSYKRGRRCLVALFAWKQSKIGKQVFCLSWVKCCRSHAPCICYVAPSASSDELVASIASFSATKEGDIASSPSSLVNT